MVDRIAFFNQVLNNIFSNAIKFSSENSKIELNVREETRYIRLSIRDNGIGIPSNLVSRLFDHLSKTTRKGTKGESGTGFGLPLANAFVKAFGGKITVISKTEIDNHGTVFHIYLQKVVEETNNPSSPKPSFQNKA